jgi:twitching motility protein PilT
VAQIDQLLGSIVRFAATGAILSSDEKVMLSFPSGPRYASLTTPHASLVRLIEEILPPGLEIDSSGGATFEYENGGGPVVVRVEANGGKWRVALEALDLPPYSRPVSGVGPDLAPPPAPPVAPAPDPEPVTDAPASCRFAEVEPATAIDRLLVQMLDMGASDLHLSTGCPPRVRVHGEMKVMPGAEAAREHVLLEQLFEITPERSRQEFERRNDTDFAHAIPEVSRFRANLFRDRRGPGAVFRAIPFEIRSPEELGLPGQVLELCYLTKGLVLVTGPTGSGKSTTLAALIDYINQNRSDHIITIEDPIEFVHENKKCLVNQREVHSHTDSFKDALRAALREDPDIVLVGEMRDLETIAIAVETAETGHLVFGTLHTTTAPSTIDRIIDQFPADRQGQIRQMLSTSLRAVISQTLCRRIGGGRVAAYEILYSTPAVANLIREAKTYQIYSVIQTNRGAGMMTLNDSLIELVRNRVVDPKEAYMLSVNKTEFSGMLGKEGFPLSIT